MPETTSISWGWTSISALAFCKALSTPKSPQPGHQSGGTSLLKSFASNFFRAIVAAIDYSPGRGWLVVDEIAVVGRLLAPEDDAQVLGVLLGGEAQGALPPAGGAGAPGQVHPLQLVD